MQRTFVHGRCLLLGQPSSPGLRWSTLRLPRTVSCRWSCSSVLCSGGQLLRRHPHEQHAKICAGLGGGRAGSRASSVGFPPWSTGAEGAGLEKRRRAHRHKKTKTPSPSPAAPVAGLCRRAPVTPGCIGRRSSARTGGPAPPPKVRRRLLARRPCCPRGQRPTRSPLRCHPSLGVRGLPLR